MSTWKRVGVMAGLVVAIVFAISMYWSQHLTNKAMDLEDVEQKVNILKKAIKYWGTNDRALYELGKAYFDYGYLNLENVAVGKDNIQKSAQSFVLSLRLNPGNFYGHYNYARTLFHLDFLSPSEDIDFVQEYKRAADLTGHRSEIYYEVGKLFLSQWHQLSEEDKEFTIEILKAIAGEGDRERFDGIIHTWEMNVRDYAVMGQILPDNPGLLRIYARFLGEKSLDQKERRNVLALAEHLEFQRAKEEFSGGENHSRHNRPKQAAPFYHRCLDVLKNIKFYQGLTGRSLIDMTEYMDLLMIANLKLAKCVIQQGVEFNEVEDYLRAYLMLSNRVADASDLDSYLVEKKVIGDKLEDSINDLDLLSFHSFLYFKQNHYRDIKNVGGLLQRSYVVVPEKGKDDYVEVLRRVADAHQITGNSYDASDFYERAMEVDEDNVATLLGMKRNYERLNAEEEIRRTDQRLDELLSPKMISFRENTIGKGKVFTQPLILDGSRVSFSLEFAENVEDGRDFPLVSVVLNGRVMWEDYLSEVTVVLAAETQEGQNRLEITPVNRAVKIMRIIRR